jgi:hypothetical protein
MFLLCMNKIFNNTLYMFEIVVRGYNVLSYFITWNIKKACLHFAQNEHNICILSNYLKEIHDVHETF